MVPEPSRMAHNITTIAATDVEITITLITLIASTLFFIILIAAGGGIASLCGMGFMRFVRYAWPVLLLPSLLLLLSGTTAGKTVFSSFTGRSGS